MADHGVARAMGAWRLTIDAMPNAELVERRMTQGTLLDTYGAVAGWWRCACIGVPAWRWPSSL